MILDIKFVILSSILIGFIIPLYIYREKVFSFIYKKGDINIFLNDIKLHMKKEHPKIPIDYSIIEKTKDEKDIRVRQTIIVEDIVSQFFNYSYEKETQGTVTKDKLWSTYEKNSPHNVKHPTDWTQRKELAWNRDNHKCNRCGREISFKDSITSFVKEIEDGGAYNIENIITLCLDCNRTINSKNPKSTMSNLALTDRLMIFVES